MAKNPRLIDISGQRFGEWLVIEQAGNTKGGGALWRSRCSCGVERPVLGADLRGGKSTNCGCAKVARIAALNVSHGESGSRLHRIWGNMRARCNRPRSTGYARYGGRGITVCDEWDRSYEAFRDWARASGYTDDLSIERVDVDGGYCPENCTWADHTTQSRNRRFVRKRADGTPWSTVAKGNGIARAVFANRISAGGWDAETAATTPLITRRKTGERGADGRFIPTPDHKWRRRKTP